MVIAQAQTANDLQPAVLRQRPLKSYYTINLEDLKTCSNLDTNPIEAINITTDSGLAGAGQKVINGVYIIASTIRQ